MSRCIYLLETDSWRWNCTFKILLLRNSPPECLLTFPSTTAFSFPALARAACYQSFYTLAIRMDQKNSIMCFNLPFPICFLVIHRFLFFCVLFSPVIQHEDPLVGESTILAIFYLHFLQRNVNSGSIQFSGVFLLCLGSFPL